MDKSTPVQNLAQELYSYLARRFPICCSSDEFVFFPQAVEDITDCSRWDDLSPDSVEDAVAFLRVFRERTGKFLDQGLVKAADEKALVSVLHWVACTLEEQFTLVRTHATQPTFTLTVATVGLIQALQFGGEDAWARKLSTLPGFLDKASASLSAVPELYRDLGVEMAGGIIKWLGSFEASRHQRLALQALDNYTDMLKQLPTVKGYRLAPDLLERIVSSHTGSGLTLKETLYQLEDEAAVTRQQMKVEARHLGYGSDWELAHSAIGMEPIPADGKIELLRMEIDRLMDHCVQRGFLGQKQLAGDVLSIEFLPPSLASIRAADSYSAKPGHPFQGGVFYLFGGGSLGTMSGMIHPVYRMTAAHEAYPGHHLLDLRRWNNVESALRPVEYPLFYEGWACFGEDLMFRTGAFNRRYDHLILLRRRFRHAVRGRVDLMLHSGDIDFNEASRGLVSAGFSENRASNTVRKYALRPAYQMCYTIGRRRFQQLFDTCGQSDVPGFVDNVLSRGEILLEDLEWVLKQTMGNG